MKSSRAAKITSEFFEAINTMLILDKKSRFVDIALNSYDFTEKEVYIKKCNEEKKNTSYELLQKLWSYSVNATLVDLDNRKVETIHFQIPDGIFWEVCDRNQENEIKDAVLKAAKRRIMIT